jgi:hypothetical protein
VAGCLQGKTLVTVPIETLQTINIADSVLTRGLTEGVAGVSSDETNA